MSSGTLETEVEDRGDTEEVAASRWAALAGRWEFDGSNARYAGGIGEKTTPAEQPFGLARCNLNLPDGTIRCAVRLARTHQSSGGILIGFHSMTQRYACVQLGAFDRAYAITEYIPGFGWSELNGVGSIQNLREDSYQVEVSVRGQRVRVVVDEVAVLEEILRTPLSSGGMGVFAYGDAPVAFTNVRAVPTPLRVFVVMPFREPYDTLYREVIKPVVDAQELEMISQRVDEIAGPGVILDDIRQQIAESHVIVAEVSTPNANVFYELGYAHALHKPAILLAKRDPEARLPFDIQGYRAIFYDDSIGGKKEVESQLRRHLQAIKQDA